MHSDSGLVTVMLIKHQKLQRLENMHISAPATEDGLQLDRDSPKDVVIHTIQQVERQQDKRTCYSIKAETHPLCQKGFAKPVESSHTLRRLHNASSFQLQMRH